MTQDPNVTTEPDLNEPELDDPADAPPIEADEDEEAMPTEPGDADPIAPLPRPGQV